jgi:hypothetical protein
MVGHEDEKNGRYRGAHQQQSQATTRQEAPNQDCHLEQFGDTQEESISRNIFGFVVGPVMDTLLVK